MLKQSQTEASQQEKDMTLMKKTLVKPTFKPIIKSRFKRKILLTLPLSLGICLILSACSNTDKPKPKYKTIETLNQQKRVETGTVVAVKTIQIKQASNNSYGNIGIAASSNGFRGIHGSIDLGTLSRIFTNNTKIKTAQEIIVKKTNGQTVAITQVSKETFKQGEAVKILVRNGQAYVIH